MRSAGIIMALLSACGSAASVLEIHTDGDGGDGKPFTKLELFFTDAAIDPQTDPLKLPRSTPGVLHVGAGAGELDVRKYDPADIYTTDATTHVTLGIPRGTGLGKYLAVIAYDDQGPIEYGEVTEVRDDALVKYDILLKPIVNDPLPATELQPLQITSPCTGPSGAGTCLHPLATMPQQAGPIPGSHALTVTVRVRGVMEPTAFKNSTVASNAIIGWYVGGTAVVPTSNAFQLHVSSPDTIYFLNNGPVDGPLRVWDYFATLTINPGATVTYSVGDQDGVQLANGAGLVAGTTLDQSAPFNGQYAQIDVVDVVESPNVARTWPVGAELWSRPGGAPSCLRLTTALGTHFVVTAGDLDCDGYADADTDCDPTLFCDPIAGSLGCVSNCTELFSHQGGQVRLSTCINGRKQTEDSCPATDAPPSFCVAQDSACPAKAPNPQTVLDCLTVKHPDVTCRYALAPGGCPQELYLQLPPSVGPAACDGAIVVAENLNGEPLTLHVMSPAPCVLSVRFTKASPAAGDIGDLMVGIPAVEGGYNTVVVHARAENDSSCPMDACDAMPEPHECRSN